MAFYENRMRSGKRRERNAESWEEEGSRYRGEYAPRGGRPGGARHGNTGAKSRFGAPAGNRQDGERTGGRGYARPGENRRGMQGNGPRREGRPPFSERRPGRGPHRPYEEKAVPQEKSYRDYEHVPVMPPREENLPADNLLVGRNPIREALKSGRDLEKLLVARGELQGSAREIIQMARDRHVNVQEVDKSRLDDIAPHHQGMVAYASAYAYASVADMLEAAESRGEDPFLIVLDGVTDPHNLGAIIRSAECAGAHGVIVPERRSVGLTPAAVKASAGAIEHMKVARVPNLNRTLEEFKRRGMWIYALTMEGKDYRKVDFKGPCVLVVGSEGEGISRLVLENSDVQVSLPMRGQIDSLNASVAAGIMMYRVLEARRS